MKAPLLVLLARPWFGGGPSIGHGGCVGKGDVRLNVEVPGVTSIKGKKGGSGALESRRRLHPQLGLDGVLQGQT